MLATLNSKQIVDEIVKDTVKDNDPHDVLDISPEIVFASRPDKAAPTLVPDSAGRSEPKINVAPETPAAAPSVDTAVRAAASDLHVTRKRSSIGKWLGGAFVTMLFAAGSGATTVAWQAHGDSAKAMIAAWMPTLVASPPPQATPPATEQPASPAPQATAADPPAEQPATPAQVQDNSSASGTASDAAQSLQSVTRDLAAMAQQIEQLRANIAELKAGQEQMAREMAKPAPPKPAEARVVDPRAKLSALPPRPAAPPVHKPKPMVYTPAYAPAPMAPPQSQAAVIPPPPPPASASQIADDDGPVVRPPMPVR
jgi:hypothetical protein